jgi:hypothetical protein
MMPALRQHIDGGGGHVVSSKPAVFGALRDRSLVEGRKNGRPSGATSRRRAPLDRAVFDLISEVVTAAAERVADRLAAPLHRPGALLLGVDPRRLRRATPTPDMPEWAAIDGDTGESRSSAD